MTTFARLGSGFALDCQEADSLVQVAARYHPDWYAQHPFSVVPDGTLHGALDNGDGTFINPTIRPPPVVQAAPDPIAALNKKIDALSAALAAAFPAVAQAMPPDQA